MQLSSLLNLPVVSEDVSRPELLLSGQAVVLQHVKVLQRDRPGKVVNPEAMLPVRRPEGNSPVQEVMLFIKQLVDRITQLHYLVSFPLVACSARSFEIGR